jgi:type I restriction enzyme S subunit
MEVKPGYKQTEVGVIPEDWRTTPLAALGTFSKGQGIRKNEASSGDLPCVRYGEIYTHHHDIIRSYNSYISKNVAHGSKRLTKGDILFAGSGETKGEIGKAVAFVDGCEVYAGGDIVILSPRPAHSEFLGYLLNSPICKRQKASKGQGDAVVHISASTLGAVIIPVPPLPEQRAIAAALSDVDALLAGLDRLIAKKRDLKQAAMQQLLTGQTRLPGFQGEWAMKRLGDVVETDPENLGADTRADFFFNYIALEDVDRGFLRSYTEQVFASAPSRARRKLKANDVLVSTVRPNLKSHLLFSRQMANWICSTGFCVLRCREGVTNPTFIFSQLFAGEVNRQIDALLTGSNYPAINSGDVRALTIAFPEFDEQTAIATVLTDMATELTALEARRDKTRSLKQGMMQELLTGRTRLV